MHKLLMSPTAIRRARVDLLRQKLSELQHLSDTGDRRPSVYATFVAITNEVERRGSKANAKPPALISRGASKLMRIADIRAKLAELLSIANPTEAERNTILFLSEETGRRSSLAKKTYWRRRSEAEAFAGAEP